jgi:hypothetical protein
MGNADIIYSSNISVHHFDNTKALSCPKGRERASRGATLVRLAMVWRKFASCLKKKPVGVDDGKGQASLTLLEYGR